MIMRLVRLRAAAFKHYESQKHFGKVCLEL